MAMSPVPDENVVEGPRVQAPLRLSDTCTCPGESNCANQPTSRSPAKTVLVNGSVVLVTLLALATDEPCTPWMPDGAGVVTLSALDCAEWLFAPSKASTV